MSLWQHLLLQDSKKSHIYFFWLIFEISTKRSQVISYPIIIWTLPKSFILNFFINWSFNYFNVLIVLNSKITLFTYTSTIMSCPFFMIGKMYASILMMMEPIFGKNFVIILFQRLSVDFNLYKLFSIL